VATRKQKTEKSGLPRKKIKNKKIKKKKKKKLEVDEKKKKKKIVAKDATMQLQNGSTNHEAKEKSKSENRNI
jgi:hypothetical protein